MATPDQYVTEEICKERETRQLETLEVIRGQVIELNDRLYRDNGHESIQTRLVKGDTLMRAIRAQQARIRALAYVVAGGVLIDLLLQALRSLGKLGGTP